MSNGASGPLVIHPGSPHWWTSPDIWVSLASDPMHKHVTKPQAGKTYNVWVRVKNKSSKKVNDWTLYVIWAIPTLGGVPVASITAAQTLQDFETITVAGGASHVFQTKKNWKPVFKNGGHECLIALTYWNGFAYSYPTLGGSGSNENYSVAQHNLGVVAAPPKKKRFHYAFQVCNDAAEEREFVVAAKPAPLTEIAAFLPGLPGGQAVMDNPGEVEGLGIVASAKPGPAEWEAAAAVLSPVKIAPRSCLPFTLGDSLPTGNALINVTQRLGRRVVGGLSVLVMAGEK